MIDYHLHTYLCCHARGTLEEYVQCARQNGLREVGFADHFPLGLMDFTPKTQVTMEASELDGYMQMVRQTAQAAEGIAVKTGVEVDYIPGKTDLAKSQLELYPFDYVMGSIHFMDDWDFTHPYYSGEFEDCSLEEVYARYFSLVRDACYSGLFDIIGHIDVVKKFGYRLEKKLVMPFYEEIAGLLHKKDICLEVNTAGLDAPVNELYPSQEMLNICARHGVRMVLGSDAHSPEQVGRHFSRAMDALREAGVKEITCFEGRKGYSVPLEGV